jgi:hypothetical protein
MSVMTADTVTVAEEGGCEESSASPASTVLEISDTWTEYRLPWSDFVGGLCGIAEVALTGANLSNLQWSIDGNYDTPEDLEFAIDDLGFYTE